MADSTPNIVQPTEMDSLFGTASIFGGDLAGAVVKTIRYTPHGDSIEEAGNTGHTKITVDVDDGWDVEATFVMDTKIAWPERGEWVSCKGINYPNDAADYDADVVSITPSWERKSTGEVTIKARYRPDRPKATSGGGAAM